MSISSKRAIMVLLTLVAFLRGTPALAAIETSSVERTPPRISLIEGEISFWRPGANDWAAAQLNTPLAPGDALYSGAGARLEVQIGAGVFVRASGETQLSLENQGADFLQLKLTTGRMAVDVRKISDGRSTEVDTPNAAFTIDSPGYYDIQVGEHTTTFVSRRGGHAAVTPAGSELSQVGPNEQVIVEGDDSARVATVTAPPLDDWDSWNYERSDHLLTAQSSHYLPPDISGADTLDANGDWETAPSYGHVWVPRNVPASWAPYSTGQWIADPDYGWTWLDDEPWGWAPYHYGRWVYWNRCWAWAPGPIVAAPVYAPALVAFFDIGSVHVGIGIPGISWVALGWGEPVVPWWGSGEFIGRPWWGGWGGPRVVNNIVINNTKIVNVENINVFTNSRVPHGVITVGGDRFGRGSIAGARLADLQPRHLQPLHGKLPITPVAESFAPRGRDAGARHVLRPADAFLKRRVMTAQTHRDRAARIASAGPETNPMRAPRSADGGNPRHPDRVGGAAPPSRLSALHPRQLALPPPPPIRGAGPSVADSRSPRPAAQRGASDRQPPRIPANSVGRHESPPPPRFEPPPPPRHGPRNPVLGAVDRHSSPRPQPRELRAPERPSAPRVNQAPRLRDSTPPERFHDFNTGTRAPAPERARPMPRPPDAARQARPPQVSEAHRVEVPGLPRGTTDGFRNRAMQQSRVELPSNAPARSVAPRHLMNTGPVAPRYAQPAPHVGPRPMMQQNAPHPHGSSVTPPSPNGKARRDAMRKR